MYCSGEFCHSKGSGVIRHDWCWAGLYVVPCRLGGGIQARCEASLLVHGSHKPGRNSSWAEILYASPGLQQFSGFCTK